MVHNECLEKSKERCFCIYDEFQENENRINSFKKQLEIEFEERIKLRKGCENRILIEKKEICKLIFSKCRLVNMPYKYWEKVRNIIQEASK